MREFQVMKQELQEMVHQRLDMSTELSDEAIGDVIDEVIMEKSRNMYMSSVTKLTLRQELFNAIRRLDLLQELIDDKSVSEIMVNGADSIFYERNGKIYTWDRHFESREKLEDVIQQIVSRSNRQVNESEYSCCISESVKLKALYRARMMVFLFCLKRYSLSFSQRF